MNLTGSLLAVSLVVNTALLVLLLRPHVTIPALGAPASLTAEASDALDPLLWPNLATADLPALLSRLRADGFPIPVIRAILSARLDEEFAARRKEIAGPQSDLPRWKLPLVESRPTAWRELAALDREKAARLKQLLGANAQPPDSRALAHRRRYFGGLPSEKAARLAAIEEDYGELRAQADIEGSTMERFEKISLLRQKEIADFAKVLSPAELETYLLRASRVANQMRHELSDYAPTEAEFLTIFRIRYPLETAFPTSIGNVQEIAAAQKEIIAQVTAALGPERGADYARAIDPFYQNVAHIAERLSLPKPVATEVWQTQKDFLWRLAATETDPALTPAARTAQTQALIETANAKISTALGPRAFEVYRQNGGAWLKAR